MSTEILKQRMAAKVEALCRQQREMARAEAARLLAESERVAEQNHVTALSRVREEHAARIAEAEQLGRWQANRLLESFQEETCREVLTRLEKELKTLALGREFDHIVRELLEEAAAAFPEYTAVFTSTEWVDTCRQWLKLVGRDTTPVFVEPDLWDGVAVGDTDRRVLVRNTLRGRLRRFEAELRRKCRAYLFGM